MSQKEAVVFGRKNLVVAITPTFVHPSNQEIQESMFDQNGQLKDEYSWKNPMQLESYSGMKINISGDGSGAACNIEATKLNRLALCSRNALADYYNEVSTEDSSNGLDFLYTKINFVPREFSSLAKKPAIEIAKAVTYEQAIAIANNFQCTGKFAAANQKQKDALQTAACIIAVIKSLPAEWFIMFEQNSQAAMAQIASYPVVQTITWLEQNFPGMLIAAYSDMNNTVPTKEVITVYNAPMKTPNNKKVDKDGYTSVYSCKITINKSSAYPVRVEVHTGKGRPSNIKVGIQSGTYVKVNDKFFDFTADEWLYALEVVENCQKAELVYEWKRITELAEWQRQVSMGNNKKMRIA